MKINISNSSHFSCGFPQGSGILLYSSRLPFDPSCCPYSKQTLTTLKEAKNTYAQNTRKSEPTRIIYKLKNPASALCDKVAHRSFGFYSLQVAFAVVKTFCYFIYPLGVRESAEPRKHISDPLKVLTDPLSVGTLASIRDPRLLTSIRVYLYFYLNLTVTTQDNLPSSGI